MNNSTNKIKGLLCLAMSLLCGLMLLAPLLSYFYYSSYTYDYYYYVTTGFDLLLEPDALGRSYEFVSVFIWINVISAIVLTIINLIALAKNNVTKKVTVGTIVVTGINVAFYTIIGVVAADITSSMDYTATTMVWIPQQKVASSCAISC